MTNKKTYQTGLLITGDAKGGVKATQLTRDGLKDLSKQQKKTGKTTKDLAGKTGSMISKLGKVTGVAALVTTTLGSMGTVMRTQTITEMKVMADTLNLSTQALSEWSTAGSKYNVDNGKMADIFKDLQDKIGDFAATGGGEAKDIFEKLNLDINEFVGLSADQQLLKIGGALDDVASHSEKIFYMEALANDASRLLPLLEDGAKGLKIAQEEARLLGTSINDVDAEMIAVAGREMQRTGDVVTGLGNIITASFSPAIGAVTGGVSDVVLSFGGWQSVVDTTIAYTLEGIGFVLDRLKPLHVTLLTIQLGWQMIGKAATSAMASSAQITADVINTVLEPFQALLWGIADGWGKILIGLGEFTGDSGITELGQSLQDFSGDVSKFSVSADDIVAADKAMGDSITNTKEAIIDAKAATRGDDLIAWWNKLTEAQRKSAIEAVKVKEAQRELGQTVAGEKGASTSELSEDYEKLIKQVDNFSGAWASAGNVIVDTFGSIGQQMEKLFIDQEKYNEALAYNRAEQAKGGENLQKLKSEEMQLTYASTQAQINSYGSIAGAAASMFDEKTKAAKTFHAIEQVMAVASLAMSVEKMIMGTTETGVHVANETTKQGANALTAITSAFAAPFPVNFIAGAAMIGIIASLLGGSFGSSGTAPMSAADRQEIQGTGTVLGSDAKSASLTNSLERSEELQLDQYAEMREMNTSLKDLNNNITHLATSFVSNFGKFDAASFGGELGKTSKYSSNGYFEKMGSEVLSVVDPLLSSTGHGDPLGALVDSLVGSFNTTKKSLVDSGISIMAQTMGDVIESGALQAQAYFDIKTKKKSFWGLSSSTSYDTEYQDINEQLEHEMALIFGNIGSTINAAVGVLGIDVANNLDNFIIDLPNFSFKDMSGDEIQKELEAMFSSQADMMATYLVPGLQEFQKVGEGLYETLIRIAQEQAVFNSVLEITGNTLNSIDANQTIAATQAIIDFAGGIENLQDAANTFFIEFYSETEQFEFIQKQLTAQFAALGVELPKTKDGFKDLISALDPLNEADQQLYAQLLLLSGQSAEYYDALKAQEDATNEAIEKEKELALERMQAISSLTDDINKLVDDLVNPNIDSLIKEEEQRQKNQQNAANELYKTEMQRYEGALNAEKTLDEYINGLAFSANSALSDAQQQRLARDNFLDAVKRAEEGDYSAVSDATSSASQYLTIAKERTGTDTASYAEMFNYVNNTLSGLSDFYADFEAPEQQIIGESAELISLREQLAASEALAQQNENQALADLLTSQLSELSDLSGDSIDSLIDSFSIDLAQLGDLLSVNLVELIEVTKQGVNPIISEIPTATSNIVVPVDNVVAFPEIASPILPGQTTEQASTTANSANSYKEVVEELKLIKEVLVALREDSNGNAGDSLERLDTQIKLAEDTLSEAEIDNFRKVDVG